MTLFALLVLSFATLALGQRPFFAGIRPIGYPEVTTESLGDRFGEVDGTTQRLPVEAHGDRDLVDRLSKLPIDQQPFWLINWQALEAHRQNPQTYPQKPNPFVDPIQNNGGSNSANSNSGNVNPNPGNVNPNSGNIHSNTGHFSPNSGNVKPNSGNTNSNIGIVKPNSNGNANAARSTASNQGDSGFLSSNRFGVKDHPNNQDPIENAFTNHSNSATSSSFKENNSSEEKKVASDKKSQHTYRN